MNLDEAQRAKVAGWIAEGEKLSSIQTRLASELGVKMTYMEVRLLVDDLKLTPKDIEPPAPPADLRAASAPPKAGSAGPGAAGATGQEPEGSPAPGGVAVTVDQLAKPGALVSGKVTFSDGNTASWQLDQTGRLGLIPQKAGYRPPTEDVQEFQMALEAELRKMGF